MRLGHLKFEPTSPRWKLFGPEKAVIILIVVLFALRGLREILFDPHYIFWISTMYVNIADILKSILSQIISLRSGFVHPSPLIVWGTNVTQVFDFNLQYEVWSHSAKYSFYRLANFNVKPFHKFKLSKIWRNIASTPAFHVLRKNILRKGR